MCFQCIILVREMYELWMNEFCMIFITKSRDIKFVMCIIVTLMLGLQLRQSLA
jgi:hypothetical protein